MTKDLNLEKAIIHQLEITMRNNSKKSLSSDQVANAISKAMYGKPISTWNRYKIGRHGGSKIKTDQLVTDDQKYLCYQIIDRMVNKGFLKDMGVCDYVLTGKEI